MVADIFMLLITFCGAGGIHINYQRKWREFTGFKHEDEDIIKIAAGSNHYLFLDSKGNVWSMGGNGYGQLGHGNKFDSHITPDRIAWFLKNGIKIVDIACGFDHSLAVDNDGKVYGWGYDKYSQCGHGQNMDTSCDVPKLIESLRGYNIVEIKCGSHHSYCRSLDGNHFMFGRNEYNECFGQSENKLPVCVNDIMHKNCDRGIECISPGFRNTTVILS